jgi:hypothetical protein
MKLSNNLHFYKLNMIQKEGDYYVLQPEKGL